MSLTKISKNVPQITLHLKIFKIKKSFIMWVNICFNGALPLYFPPYLYVLKSERRKLGDPSNKTREKTKTKVHLYYNEGTFFTFKKNIKYFKNLKKTKTKRK